MQTKNALEEPEASPSSDQPAPDASPDEEEDDPLAAAEEGEGIKKRHEVWVDDGEDDGHGNGHGHEHEVSLFAPSRDETRLCL